MKEDPDPANSQGQEEGNSSETWTSWLNTCSPVQHTLLTACMVEMYKETRIRPLVLVNINPALIIIEFFRPVKHQFMGFVTYISEIVRSFRKGGTIS